MLKNDFTLAQWLQYLETRHPSEIQLGLTRIKAVASKMQLLTPVAKIITVAGTNGKGSTVAGLEAIYHAAGFRVGAYTSPHLLHFNERIRVNKVPIRDEALCRIFHEVENARGEIPLTYFEVVTLSALWYYMEQNLDVIVLEVGLGGRLDATNILNADVAIISTIAFDHEAYLGNTLEAIAYEKAGIIRTNKPCIYADHNPPSTIDAEIKKQDAMGYYLGKDYQIREEENHFTHCFLQETQHFPKPRIQLRAAAAALTAVSCLHKDLPVSLEAKTQALQNLQVPGRLDLHKNAVSILYDVAHNPQAAGLLADYLKRYACKGKVHAVFSALDDKDLKGLIAPLRDCVDHWYPAQLNTKRAASKAKLMDVFYDQSFAISAVYADPMEAFLMAKTSARAQDLILVYGSFYTVAAIMEKEIR